MNGPELQYAIDRRGYVDIDEASQVDGYIELGHLTGKVHIVSSNSSTLSRTGPSGRHLFEYNYKNTFTHDPPEIYFHNIVHGNSASNSGFFRVRSSGRCPARLHFDNCSLRAAGNYAIDCPSGGEMECLVIERSEFGGGGAIRWHSASDAQANFTHIITNRYVGDGKPGSTFNFKNVKNLTMRSNTLDGSVDLVSGLSGTFEGAVAIQIINPIGLCMVDDFWFEPWSDWDTDAPGCWGFTGQTDDDNGSYGQRALFINNISMNAAGLGESTILNHFIGGHNDSDAASMLAVIEDQWQVAASDYKFGGKVRVIMERATNPNSSDEIETTVDGFVSGSYRDPLRMGAFELPFNDTIATSGDGITYPDSPPITLATNWVATAAEYDS